MADLGSIGIGRVAITGGKAFVAGAAISGTSPATYKISGKPRCIASPLVPGCVSLNASATLINCEFDGDISGTVRENGIAIADCVVLLLHRSSGLIVDKARTNAAGTFAFSDLELDHEYCALAFDPVGGVSYNAIVFDKIAPL